MPFHPSRLHIAVLFLAILALPVPAMAQTPVGTVERVENLVTAEYSGLRRGLVRKAPLFRTEILRSYDAARLEAALTDGTTITMGENAVLTITDFRYAPGAGRNALRLRVLEGPILFKGGRVEDGSGSAVSVKTTFGLIGVRGTTFWAGPLDGAFAVFVAGGRVTVSNVGTTVTLDAGEGTTIAGPDDPPRPPVVWPQDKVARALAAVQ